MSLRLRSVLDHPLMRRADPVVADPRADLDRAVRWVHSSEIYEIAPLLRGDELLLTTGLGLAGRDAGERCRYVVDLAAAGVAGVAIEVGRTFREVPADVLRTAAEVRLPLVVLRGVVPFVEIAEAVNAAILDSAVTRLRHVNEIVRVLSGVLARGAGVDELTRTLARLADRPVVLAGIDGTIAAWAGTDTPALVLAAPSAAAGVELRGALWGRLLLGSVPPAGVGAAPWSSAAPDVAGEVAEHAAQVFAPALLRLADRGGWVGRERRELVEGLLGDALPPREVAARLTVCGLVPAGTAAWATVALDLPDRVRAVTALYEGVRACGGRALVGDGPGAAYALVALDRATHVGELTERLGLPAGDGTAGSTAPSGASGAPGSSGPAAASGPTAALGPVVRDVARIGHSLRAARDTLRLARRVRPVRTGPVADTVLADDWALERVLDRLGPEELADLVEDQLGPLLAADAERGTGLVATLETYLRCGCSKTATSGLLYLRRQSVHQRLALIESLLSVSPDDPGRHGPLRAALAARELLATRAPRRG